MACLDHWLGSANRHHLFFAALLAHAWVGLHVVITDYVHTIAVRIGLLLLMGLGLTTISVWVMQILWLRHG
jgi:succinate dehydrogenase / fumarate reductase, membrane anchor subunit